MVKVMIVEDQPMVRLAMEQYLASGKCYQTVASISNAAMAEAVCRKCGADLILMDICTEEDESGLAAAKKIKKALPWVKIVIRRQHFSEPLYSTGRRRIDCICFQFSGFYQCFGDICRKKYDRSEKCISGSAGGSRVVYAFPEKAWKRLVWR